MPHGNAAAAVGAVLKPVEDQGLQYQLGIGQMAGAILFERIEEFRIEPVCTLTRRRLTGRLHWL